MFPNDNDRCHFFNFSVCLIICQVLKNNKYQHAFFYARFFLIIIPYTFFGISVSISVLMSNIKNDFNLSSVFKALLISHRDTYIMIPNSLFLVTYIFRLFVRFKNFCFLISFPCIRKPMLSLQNK